MNGSRLQRILDGMFMYVYTHLRVQAIVVCCIINGWNGRQYKSRGAQTAFFARRLRRPIPLCRQKCSRDVSRRTVGDSRSDLAMCAIPTVRQSAACTRQCSSRMNERTPDGAADSR